MWFPSNPLLNKEIVVNLSRSRTALWGPQQKHSLIIPCGSVQHSNAGSFSPNKDKQVLNGAEDKMIEGRN